LSRHAVVRTLLFASEICVETLSRQRLPSCCIATLARCSADPWLMAWRRRVTHSCRAPHHVHRSHSQTRHAHIDEVAETCEVGGPSMRLASVSKRIAQTASDISPWRPRGREHIVGVESSQRGAALAAHGASQRSRKLVTAHCVLQTCAASKSSKLQSAA